ncbi:MAG: hypothetical protein AAGJ18_14620 [Bacteroidota bacterium]
MKEQQPKRLHFEDISQQKMYELFGLRQVAGLEILDSWLSEESSV